MRKNRVEPDIDEYRYNTIQRKETHLVLGYISKRLLTIIDVSPTRLYPDGEAMTHAECGEIWIKNEWPNQVTPEYE